MTSKPSKRGVDLDPLFLELFPRKASKGDLRKAAIIEEAIRVIGTQGIEGLSFDSIGRSLKIRRSHVAYYFKSKWEIVEAAMKFGIATGQMIVTRYLRAVDNPVDQLHSYIRGTFFWVKKYPNQISVFLLMYHLASYDKRWKQLNSEFKNAGMGRVREIIGKGWRGPISKPNLDKLALRAHDIIIINIFNSLAISPAQSLKEIEKKYDRRNSKDVGEEIWLIHRSHFQSLYSFIC